ncbi:MAG: hypothetical protein R3D69_07120 [Xanthobacteraceae bacterium]
MTGSIDVTRRFLSGLSSSDEATLRAVLIDSPKFEALGAKLNGADDVLNRIARQPTRDLYRAVAWDAPETHGSDIRAIGRMPEGAARSGVVLTLKFEGDRIAVIQHQHLPPRPAPATALKLTPALKQLINNSLATKHPMLIAYADETGQPVLSFRGSIQAHSDDQLALWILQHRRAFSDGDRKQSARRADVSRRRQQGDLSVSGGARVATNASEWERIYNASAYVEQAHDFAQMGTAVVIDPDKVEGYAGLGPGGQNDKILMVRTA